MISASQSCVSVTLSSTLATRFKANLSNPDARSWHSYCLTRCMTLFRCVTLSFLVFTIASCSADAEPDDNAAGPYGPKARNAQEAWPEAPSSVSTVTHRQIAETCARLVECNVKTFPLSCSGTCPRNTVAINARFCVEDLVFSTERSIPASGLAFQHNERTEYLLSCTKNVASCQDVEACLTKRHKSIYCEEDGCRNLDDSVKVTCDGSIATVGPVKRDCHRAFARCDESSPTGCTDRPFTRCPANVDFSDHCDGNIRLGCDGKNQVSYRDCSRMGGTCVEVDGRGTCRYPVVSPECTGDSKLHPTCENGQLSLCVNQERVTLPLSLCKSS